MMSTRLFAIGTIIAAVSASPALAGGLHTKLVSCEAGNCLLVSGRRGDPSAIVEINGHPVPTDGGRNWRIRLPVETLRAWSAPYAREITVSVVDHGAREAAATSVRLPIGMLGHAQALAMLVVSAK